MCKIFEDFGREMREEGSMRTLLDNIKAIMKNLNYTAEQAMDTLHVPEEERDGVRGRITAL